MDKAAMFVRLRKEIEDIRDNDRAEWEYYMGTDYIRSQSFHQGRLTVAIALLRLIEEMEERAIEESRLTIGL